MTDNSSTVVTSIDDGKIVGIIFYMYMFFLCKNNSYFCIEILEEQVNVRVSLRCSWSSSNQRGSVALTTPTRNTIIDPATLTKVGQNRA